MEGVNLDGSIEMTNTELIFIHFDFREYESMFLGYFVL